MSQIFQLPKELSIDDNFLPMAGALAYFYQTGTVTPQDTYQDYAFADEHQNPVEADAAGRFPPIWLDSSLPRYKLVLKTAAGATVYTVDPVNQFILTAAEIGALLNRRTDAEISAGVTPVDYTIPSHDAVVDFLLERYGGGAGVAAATNVTAITNATAVASAAGGGTVVFPAGTLDANARLVPLTDVNWRGAGKYATVLNCTAADGAMTDNLFIDARGSGSGGFPADRKIISISDMTIKGLSAGDNVKGIGLGWNMRSMPLLARVLIQSFGHYGIGFLDQNWNIAFEDVEVDSCGGRATNSTGVYKDPAVDASTWNYITFTRCQIEGCGSASSTAGGLNLQTTTSNRGLYFTDCIVEGNFGTDEIYITNNSDVQFKNLYMERENVSGQTTGIELSGVKGSIHGGFITAAGANNTLGLQLKSSCDIALDAVDFASSWATAAVDVQGSKLRVGRNFGATYQLDATAQISGAVRPMVSVQKNAHQTGIVTNTFTKVAFQTEDYDVTAAFDSATNYRWTPQTFGYYLLTASVSWDDVETASDQFIIAIYKNGLVLVSETERQSATEPFSQTITAIAQVTATTDYFEVFVRHLGTANRAVQADATATWFRGALIEAAQ